MSLSYFGYFHNISDFFIVVKFLMVTCLVISEVTILIVWGWQNHNRSVNSVQFSRVRLFATWWITAHRPPCPSPTPGVYPNTCHWVGDAIQSCHPLSSPSPLAFKFSQQQGLFKWVSSSYKVDKVLEFQLQCHSFHEHSGLILFRMDWVDLLAVQGTLKSLLQHHIQKHQFFGTQLSS